MCLAPCTLPPAPCTLHPAPCPRWPPEHACIRVPFTLYPAPCTPHPARAGLQSMHAYLQPIHAYLQPIHAYLQPIHAYLPVRLDVWVLSPTYASSPQPMHTYILAAAYTCMHTCPSGRTCGYSSQHTMASAKPSTAFARTAGMVVRGEGEGWW